MNNELKIHIPQNQPELESAVLLFLEEEFQQQGNFKNEDLSTDPNKDADLIGGLWKVLVFAATLEGALQLSERARRLEHVKKLEAAIQKTGKPVYMRIKNKSINLYQKSADQIMDLLAGDEDDK